MSPVHYQPSRNTSAVFSGLPEVALHHVRAAHEHQAGLAERQIFPAPRIFRADDAHAHARQWMADFPAFGADLLEPGGAEIRRVHRHHRRAFGAAVTFERADAEMFLERRGQPVGQFFRAGHHQAQAAEIRRRAAAQVELQKRRRGQQEGDLVLADERADGLRVERIRMINHAHAKHRRQTERAGETE